MLLKNLEDVRKSITIENVMVKCHLKSKRQSIDSEILSHQSGRKWSIAVGWLFRIFTDVKAFSAKAQE